jgi:hypothetical protein
VSSAVNPISDTFVCALSPVSIPKPHLPHTLTVQLRRTADESANPGWTIIALLEGSRVVAAKLVQPAVSAFTDETLTLTQDEVDSITDYSNLRLRVTAGVPVVTPTGCCNANPIPAKLVATITSSFECCFAEGEKVELNYDSSKDWWIGTYGVSPCPTSTFKLFCCGNSREDGTTDFCDESGGSVDDWSFFIVCDGGAGDPGVGTAPAPGATCNPVNMVFYPGLASGCCSASSSLAVSVKIH